MGNDVVFEPDYYEEDQEEVLSLRDLPLSPPSHSSSAAADHHHTTTASRRSSADFTFCEFHENEDAAADEIIFRGHLLPFAPPPPPPRRSLSLSSASSAALTRHTSTNSRPMRPSRSLHCRKLHRNSSLNAKTERFSRNSSNSNSTSSRSSSNNNSDNPKLPPWYWLVLGIPARVPAEMDMKDIKNRQFRRSSSSASLFSGDRSSSSVSWRFLSVLSCKSHASVDVMNTTGVV